MVIWICRLAGRLRMVGFAGSLGFLGQVLFLQGVWGFSETFRVALEVKDHSWEVAVGGLAFRVFVGGAAPCLAARLLLLEPEPRLKTLC